MLAVVAVFGCGEDSEPDDGTADTTEVASSGAQPEGPQATGAGANCVDGDECGCPDGSSGFALCTPELMCFCAGEAESGGVESDCGTSVPLSGAVDGSFEDERCGIGNTVGQALAFTFGAILEPEVFTVTVRVPLQEGVPAEGTADVFYVNSQLPDARWSTPMDSCVVTITENDTTQSRPRVAGSVSCPEPASDETAPDIIVGDFEFVGELYN